MGVEKLTNMAFHMSQHEKVKGIKFGRNDNETFKRLFFRFENKKL